MINLFLRSYTLSVGNDITSIAGDIRIRGKHSYPIRNRKDFVLMVNRRYKIDYQNS